MKFCTVYLPNQEMTCICVAANRHLYPVHELLQDREPFLSAWQLTNDRRLSWLNELFETVFDSQTVAEQFAWAAELRLMEHALQNFRHLPQTDLSYAPVVQATSLRDFFAFEEHVRTARSNRGLDVPPEWYQFPVFYFSNHQSILGHDAELPSPTHGKWLDYELEVAAVIGVECRDVPAEAADEVIAGYTILNDWSLRDLQIEEVKVGLGPAKGKDFATSLGPFLVTPDELEDRRSGKGYDLEMVARVNGVELSRGNWRDIHWSFSEMITRASQGVTLYPGDVLGSGTVGSGCILELGAENVAAKLDRKYGWLQAGDVVELEVERLGVLRNKIVKDSDSLAL